MARYSINPDTEVYHESGANEMHRLSRKATLGRGVNRKFPINIQRSENETVHAARSGIRAGARIR